MKKLLAIFMCMALISGCTSNENMSNTNQENNQNDVQIDTKEENLRQITDMIGRVVDIPMEINKVYCAEPTGAIYLYHVSPDKLLGWNYEPTDTEKVLLLEEYQNLETYGMGSSINFEAVLANSPQICVVAYDNNDESLLANIENYETLLNIPVVAVSADLLEAPKAYEFLGELLNEQEQGEALSNYAQNIFDSIIEIPKDEQKALYFGNGENSLETAPVGSLSAQEFELLHINNVAYIEGFEGNRTDISAEQILAWNPEIMLVNGEPKQDLTQSQAVLDILNDPLYANVTAVVEKQVIGVPKSPFSFISRPTGPNRLIGIEWLKCVVYPEYYDLELEEVMKEIYSLFYHIELTEEQIKFLIG